MQSISPPFSMRSYWVCNMGWFGGRCRVVSSRSGHASHVGKHERKAGSQVPVNVACRRWSGGGWKAGGEHVYAVSLHCHHTQCLPAIHKAVHRVPHVACQASHSLPLQHIQTRSSFCSQWKIQTPRLLATKRSTK